jgi:hypothetical protein
MMRNYFTIAAVAALCGCSTGIVPTDQGKYMIENHGGGPAATGETIKADVYKEANKFCEAKGLTLLTVSIKTQNTIPFVHGPSASLEFKCVPAPVAAASAPQ